jgi:hypothetical protein
MAQELFDAAQGAPGKQAAAGGVLFGMSMWGMLVSLVFSGAGLFYFKWGRSKDDTPMVICGAILMIYPYFITNALYMTLIGLVLLAAPWIINKYDIF